MKSLHVAVAGPISTISLIKYFNSGINMPKGTGGTSVNHTVEGLLAENIKVSVYTLTPEIEKPIFFKGNQLSIFFGPYRKKARYRVIDLFKQESDYIARFAIEDKPDIVHAQWGYEYADGAIKSKLPYVITLRDSPITILKHKRDMYRFFRLLLNKKVMRKGRNFTVNSAYLNHELGTNFPIIYNTVYDYKLEVNKSEKVKVVSAFNGWGNRKNPHKGLEAFALLREKLNRPIEYHIFGQDFGKGEIAEKWAIQNDLNKNVFFRGIVNHKELIKEFSTATVFLHPAKEESFGNVIAEAFSVGTPVIGGINSGAVPWLLGYGKRGKLVDVTNYQEVCNAMLQLIEDKKLQQEYIKEAYLFVNENLRLDVIAKKNIEIYHKILAIDKKRD